MIETMFSETGQHILLQDVSISLCPAPIKKNPPRSSSVKSSLAETATDGGPDTDVPQLLHSLFNSLVHFH